MMPAPHKESAVSYVTQLDSPLGTLTLASDGTAVTGLWIDGQKNGLATLEQTAQRNDALPVFTAAARWLDAYFDGRNPRETPPLRTNGSPFREQVWAELRQIPYGKLTTYGGIARILAERTGRRVSAQAVGGAVGHNPISILIPCHRVVGMDGSLTGYAGGLDKKIALLTLEGVDQTGLYRPERGTAL